MPIQLKTWLLDWAWGKKSASDVVRDAHAAAQDLPKRTLDPRILRLAKTITNLGNAERVVQSLSPDLGLGKPTYIPDSSIELVMTPSTVWTWLLKSHPARFRAHLGAQRDGVQEWWEQFLRRPAAAEFWSLHPWLEGRTPSDLRWHLPLMLFDDAGPISAHNSSFVRVWYSIVGRGNEKETRFLMCSGLKDKDKDDMSWPVILESFEELAKPVEAGSWGGILLFIGADLDYACNVLGMPHYNGGPDGICMACEANATTIPHNTFHANATWRGTVVCNQRFMDRIRTPLHPLAEHAFFTKYTYRYCLLHMVDHHGVGSHIVGNIVWTHLSGDRDCDVLEGANLEDRVTFLNAKLKAWYSEHRVQNKLPTVKATNFKDGDRFPELKGNGVKAANTKAVIPFVLELQQRATRLNPSPRNKHMEKVVLALQTAIDIMYSAGHFLDDETWTALDKNLTRLGQHYQYLAVMEFKEGRMRWQTIPKLHCVSGQLAEQAALINPRHVQGYASESMVGEMCRIYNRCQSGPFERVIQRTVMRKYTTGLQLMWV